MSNSIIHFKDKYFNPNDIVLLVSLSLLKETISKEILPDWFKSYLNEVVDVILDVKPIGWAYLELDEYFDKNEHRLFFIHIINKCLLNLKSKETKIIDNSMINDFLNFEGAEKLNKEYFLEVNEIKKCLNCIALLLDDQIDFNHKDLFFYSLYKPHSTKSK